MYLKSVVYTGRQATPAPHVYVWCVCVSMCNAEWGEGWNTVPPSPLPITLPVFPISLAWPLCFCVVHWQACVSWEDPPLQPPPVPPPSPSLVAFFSLLAPSPIVSNVYLWSHRSHRTLSFTLSSSFGSSHPLSCLVILSRFSPILSSPSLSCSSLVGPFLPSTGAPWWDSCFLPQRSFSAIPILHCRSSREPQTLPLFKIYFAATGKASSCMACSSLDLQVLSESMLPGEGYSSSEEHLHLATAGYIFLSAVRTWYPNLRGTQANLKNVIGFQTNSQTNI